MFGGLKKTLYLCTRLQKARAFSSAGLEHLPYKQRVGGSNPSTPTKGVPKQFGTLFLLNIKKMVLWQQIIHFSLFTFHFYFVPLHHV